MNVPIQGIYARFYNSCDNIIYARTARIVGVLMLGLGQGIRALP